MLLFVESVGKINWGDKMKTIEIKEGNKTTYKIVPDNYEPTDDTICRDMTTSGRKSMGFTDIPKERWDSIFNKDKKDT
jgi:hypothetical protein